MSQFIKRAAVWALAGLGLAAANNVHAADLDYGKPGDPIHLVVGYQPYYSEAWSGAVINGLQLWKKYLPKGSTVEFHIGLQGSIIVNSMLAGKAGLGYLGDMPAIVATTKRSVADCASSPTSASATISAMSSSSATTRHNSPTRKQP